MSLVVNNNLMANTAARNLSASYGKVGESTERLSSGLRINSASDDAAGLAIRELMRSDVSTLNQGVRNANDGISLVQTADGALSVIDEKLIRMKELAEQAATGTYTSTQRLIIDSEYQAMASEITRIANATDFNGIKLLNGNLSGIYDGSGDTSTGALAVHFGTGNDSAEDYYTIQINSCTAASLGLTSNGDNAKSDFLAKYGAVAYDHDSTWGNWSISGQLASDKYSFLDASGTIEIYTLGTVEVAVGMGTDGNLYGIGYMDTSVTNLGSADGPSLATQTGAEEALETIDKAIISKDNIRASLGAMQNRLSATADVLGIQSENVQAAESQISDVDVATEMTEYTKQQIVTQAAVAMLSQANSLPQMALSLLG